MTRRDAAVLLRDLADGDTSELGQALAVAVAALEPAARKPKPKVDRHLAAFLKMSFPPMFREEYLRGEYVRNVGHEPPRIDGPAAAQFSYGMTKRHAPNAAVLMAARVSG